jgi:hypothetical protein
VLELSSHDLAVEILAEWVKHDDIIDTVDKLGAEVTGDQSD